MNQYDEEDLLNVFVKLLVDDQSNWIKVWE